MFYRSVFTTYRTDGVEIVRTFQYNDSANDHFEREPYSVLIRSREEGGKIEIISLVLCRPHPLMAHVMQAGHKTNIFVAYKLGPVEVKVHLSKHAALEC